MGSPSYKPYSRTVAGNSASQPEDAPEDLEALLLRRTQLLAQFTEQAHEVESRRLEREQVRGLWLNQFGKEFLAAEEACLRKADAELALQLLEVNPAMSRMELERTLFDRRATSEERRQVLRLDVSRAAHRRLTPQDAPCADEAEVARWTQEARTLTRKLWLSLHPDVRQPETWARLSDNQRKKLEHILHGLDQPQHDELGLSPGFVFYDQPSPVALRRKLATVQAILAHAGLEIEDEFLVCGATEQGKIEFVRNDIVPNWCGYSTTPTFDSGARIWPLVKCTLRFGRS
jgi:hypothetical protein